MRSTANKSQATTLYPYEQITFKINVNNNIRITAKPKRAKVVKRSHLSGSKQIG